LPIVPTITQTPAGPVSNLPIVPTITQTPAPVSNLPIVPTITQTPAPVSNLPIVPTITQNPVVAPAAAPINLAPIPTPDLAANQPPGTNRLFSPSLQQQNQISNSLQQRNSPPASGNLDASKLPPNLGAVIFPVEERFTSEFVDYLNLPSTTALATLEDAQNTLRGVQQATGIKPALIYISFVPQGSTVARPYSSSPLLRVEQQIQASDELELMVIAPEGRARSPAHPWNLSRPGNGSY
jgi:hypothetical protein